MWDLLETKRRGAGELRDNLRLGSRGHGAGDVRQRKEAVESGGVSNALVVGQDGPNGESRIVVIEGNDGLVGRVLFGLLHKVYVGIEDVVSLAQVVAGEATPQLGTVDSLWSKLSVCCI
jgi:hypothetical protein